VRFIVIMLLTALAPVVVCDSSSMAQSSRSGAARSPTTPLPTPSNPATSAPSPAPSPAIGQPSPAVAPLPPMSPQITTTPLSGGSVTTKNPSTPSEAAQSTPGGGGSTLADCMKFWDSGTHMTKSE
jgi:hypothetical protein